MDYFFDTNIMLNYLRKSKLSEFVNSKYDPLDLPNSTLISVVSVGEIKSIATQSKWGIEKWKALNKLITQKFVIVDINNKEIIDRYAEIDAFSQGKLTGRNSNFSSRNMRKNDLWIAATVSILKIPLLTTDKDFDHLRNEYISLDIIDQSLY